jgi:hypothetical protein
MGIRESGFHKRAVRSASTHPLIAADRYTASSLTARPRKRPGRVVGVPLRRQGGNMQHDDMKGRAGPATAWRSTGTQVPSSRLGGPPRTRMPDERRPHPPDPLVPSGPPALDRPLRPIQAGRLGSVQGGAPHTSPRMDETRVRGRLRRLRHPPFGSEWRPAAVLHPPGQGDLHLAWPQVRPAARLESDLRHLRWRPQQVHASVEAHNGKERETDRRPSAPRGASPGWRRADLLLPGGMP